MFVTVPVSGTISDYFEFLYLLPVSLFVVILTVDINTILNVFIWQPLSFLHATK